ncbi:hypothetical protein [Streptomyces lunaelactis]|uniref:hypothetical protein n=1 Tax=Streptomyces lunaelactis TaxID=1535768 RepID=UPI001585425F|nr:hypothetical protein [Streptomyces lunaelactis]NUK60043.1 hypothetical protein [Streptomyces lunaelactis]
MRALRRILAHELRAMHSLALWVARRRHGVAPGHSAAYTGPQTAMMYGFIFVSVVETVALAVLVPWPLVQAITLVIDVYGVLLMVALHASCVTRPHLVGPDGSLRIRYGALFDLRIRADEIVGARVERRYPEGRLIQPRGEGSLDLIVANQTTVAVELAAPVRYVRPLGKQGRARVVRFHADDPKALVHALTQVRTAPSPSPGPPV